MSVRILFSAVMLLVSSIVLAQTDSITSQWIRDHYQKREVMVTMRDGARLFTSIYEPKDQSVKHPILMSRTCYGSTPYGEDSFKDLESPAWREYARNGYIIVFQDVRGKNFSEGKFEDIRPFVPGKKTPKYNKKGEVVVKKDAPIDEASDTYDTAEWLIHNTNNNGNIGVFGISYPGFYTTMATLSGHPAIKAVSPQAPVTDWYRGDDVHHNGAFFYSDMFSFMHWFEHVNTAAFQNAVLSNDMKALNAIAGKSPRDTLSSDIYNDFLKLGAIKNLTKLLGDSVTGWNDIINHPDLDSWWEDRNVLYHINDIKPAVLVVGGLFDAEDGYGAFATYKQIKRNSPQTDLYLVEGPWAHGAWGGDASEFFGNLYFGPEQTADYYLNNIEYPFFAYYLEGKGERPTDKAKVFDSGNLTWINLAEGWPLETEKTPYYLTSNGLSTEAPKPGTKPTIYTSDPSRPVPYSMEPTAGRVATYMVEDQRFAATRPDVAVFKSDVLTDTLQLLGDIDVELDVALTSTDADFVVKVIDVFPEGFSYPDSIYHNNHKQSYLMSGYQMLVRGDIMRGKYRESLSDPQPFVPGERTKVKFTLNDVAHTLLPGHQLMVQVQSSWFPIVDRNPQKFCNIYTCDDEDFQTSTITIYPESKVMLPVVDNSQQQ